MIHTSVQTPRGVKDILPREAYYKSRLQRRAADFLASWGYQKVITPTFEYDDALKKGDQPIHGDQLYRFVDRDGNTLALRPEMTTPIARLVATRYRPEQMPIRLHYIGSVFRHDEPQAGRHREFTQIGVELVGAYGRRADGEVVTLAAGLLGELGLGSFRLDLGHTDYFLGLVNGADGSLVRQLRDALLARDFVRYETVVHESALSDRQKNALARLPYLRGSGESVRDIVEEGKALADGMPEALGALRQLVDVIELVGAYGEEKRIGIDLGMMKDLDYYSGLQMEGYVPELGFTLCTGGRYDHLIGRYGWEAPAIGFALGVERAMLALDRQQRNGLFPPPADVYLFAHKGEGPALFQAASLLRNKGVTVQLDVSGDESPGDRGGVVAKADGEPNDGNHRMAARVFVKDGTLQFHVDTSAPSAVTHHLDDGRHVLTLDELVTRLQSEEGRS